MMVIYAYETITDFLKDAQNDLKVYKLNNLNSNCE